MTARIPGNPRPSLRPSLAYLVAIAVFSCATSLAPARGDDPSRLESLDVFVLVDVSRSMYLTLSQVRFQSFDPAIHGRPGGSDPERQRWDAVRLLLDLLTADDRVTILPFNEIAPARFQYQGLEPFEVPGHVADPLQSPRSDQDRLGRQVEEFAHNRDFPPGNPTNRDLGGTGIFFALKESNRRAASESHEVGRKPVILLLTDGDDTELNKELRTLVDRDDSALLAQVRGEGSPRRSIPIYTMGLGGEVKDELLVRIARVTGGSYRKIGPATDLVPTFRDLIWSLKYCWIKSAKTEARHSREELEGILDLGVLSYRSQAGASRQPVEPFSREARKPSPSSAISDADFGRFSGQRRMGNQGRDYLYEYFGPLSLRSGSIDADWSRDAPGDPRSVSFSKRTARPLFRLSEPSEGGEVDRLERLRITATFNAAEPFRPEHFRLYYSLRPAGEDPRSEGLMPMDESFHAEAILPRSGRDSIPRYTLRVEAEGIGDPDRLPLAGYRLILPEKTIEVRDILRLVADPPALTLSGKSRQATVRIRGVRPLGAEVKLSYRLEPPVERGVGPIPIRAISARPHLGSSTRGEVVFDHGSAAIDLDLASGADQPALGAEYDPGVLVVSGGEELGVAKTELRIPIRLQLRRAALTIAGSGPIRAVSGGIDPHPPMRLKVVEDGGLGLAAQDMKAAVTLKRVGGADFPPGELWIEPADVPVAPSARSRTLNVPIGQEFLVRFNPSSNFGQHAYELDARLAGKDERQAVPARASVSLEYEFPSLTLSTSSVTVRVPPGESRRVTVRASLRGPAGLRRPVIFRPETPSRDEPFVEVVPQANPVMVGVAETLVNLEVKATADAPHRKYAIKGTICDREGGAKETALTVVALVDELRVADRTANLANVRKPIPVELWMGAAHTRRLELSTALEGSLPGPIRIAAGPRRVDGAAGEASQAGRLGISAEVDPRDDGGAFLLPRRANLKMIADDASGRAIAIEFPAVSNVEANRAYRVYLDLLPDPDTGLAPRLLEFEVRYRRTDDLQPATP
jgi:hypothetical protein